MKIRLDYLDSIRGVAALLVVFQHICEVYIKYDPSAYPLIAYLFETINVGRLGVIVFFITSGFVIPWSFNFNDPNALKNFMIKRFFRLYPAYWFSIIAAVVIGISGHVESVQQVLLNFTMIHKFLGVQSVLGSYWTLHVELIFYVSCIGLFYFGVLNKNGYLMIAMILFCLLTIAFAAVRYFYQVKIPIIMPLGLAAMFYGALLRNYLIDKQENLKIPLILLAGFYFLSLFIAQRMYYLEGWFSWYITHVAAFVLFYVLVTKVKLTDRFSVYIGRISYSLYLLHPFLIASVFGLFDNFAYTEYGFYVVIAITLVASILVADLSYRLIEKQSLKLSRNFVYTYKK